MDNGWAGLYVITVGYGQTAVTAASISTLPTAPFLAWKLPALRPGFASGVQAFYASGYFTVPAGVSTVEVEVWGAGSGSYASVTGVPSGGGARWRLCAQAHRRAYARTGDPSHRRRRRRRLAPRRAPAPPGGTSSFGAYVSATGGSLNSLASSAAPQNGATPAGLGVSGDANFNGSDGQTGTAGIGGMGGAASGGGTRSVAGSFANAGYFPGGGATGAGSQFGAQNGSWGANGFVIVRW